MIRLFSNRAIRSKVSLVCALALVAAFIGVAAQGEGYRETKVSFNDSGVWQSDGARAEIGHLKLGLGVPGALIALTPKPQKALIEVEQGRAGVIVVDRSASKLHVIDDRRLARLKSVSLDDAASAIVRVGDVAVLVATGTSDVVRLGPLASLARSDNIDVLPRLVSPGSSGEAAGPTIVEMGLDGTVATYALRTGRIAVYDHAGVLKETTLLPRPDGGPAELSFVGATPIVLRQNQGDVVVLGNRAVVHDVSPGWRLAMPSHPAEDAILVDPEGAHWRMDLRTGGLSQLALQLGPDPIRPLVMASGVIASASQSTGRTATLLPASLATRSGPAALREGPKLGSRLHGRLVWGKAYIDDLDTAAGSGFEATGEAHLLKAAAPDEVTTNGPGTDQKGGRSATPRPGDASGSSAASNRKPTLNDDPSLRARPNRSTVLAVLANDRDPDGDALTVTEIFDPPVQADVAVAPGGNGVVITPQPGFSGKLSFGYGATDPSGLSSTATATVTVTDVGNDPPVATKDAATAQVGIPVLINALSNDRDPDGDSITLSTVRSSDGTITTTSSGLVSFTPRRAGASVITYTVIDERGASTRGTIEVDVAPLGGNLAPVLRPDSFTVALVPTELDVLANDVDPEGVSLRITRFTKEVGNGRVEQVGERLRIVPTRPGVAEFSYQATDGDIVQETTVRVHVGAGGANRPPVALPDRAAVRPDEEATVDVVANDSDPDGDVLAVVSWSVGDPAVQVTSADARRLRFSVTGTLRAPVPVAYTISDGTNRATGTVLLSAAPSEVGIAPLARNDTGAVRLSVGRSLAVLTNDVDPDGGPLRITDLLDAPAGVSIAGSGRSVLIAPTAAAPVGATLRFRYRVSDDDAQTAEAAVELAVVAAQGVNTAPVANTDRVVAQSGRTTSIAVLNNDADFEGDALVLLGVGQPVKGVVLVIDGQVRYEPNAGATGTDRFSYTIDDGHGGTATGDVHVGILPPAEQNRPPTPQDDGPIALAAGQRAQSLEVLANDTDPDGDVLTITAIESPSVGKAAIADGVIRYTPPAKVDAEATVQFRYTVSDPSLATGRAIVRVTIKPSLGGGKAPVAVPDRVGPVSAGDTVQVAVLDNDEDPDGPNSQLRVTRADGGTVSADGRSVTVKAPASTGVLSYAIRDAEGLSAVGSIEVRVVADRPPRAVSDTATSTGQAVTVAVLDNDVDPEGQPLKVRSVSTTPSGTSSTDGKVVRFQPSPTATGSVKLNYVVADLGGQTATGVITIEVTTSGSGTNRPPVARKGDVSLNQGTSSRIDLAGVATDPDGDELLYEVNGTIDGVTLSLAGSTVTFSASPSATPTAATIAYVATDPDGARAESFIVVTVRPGVAPTTPSAATATSPTQTSPTQTAPAQTAPLPTSPSPTSPRPTTPPPATAPPTTRLRLAKPGTPVGIVTGRSIAWTWTGPPAATGYLVDIESVGTRPSSGTRLDVSDLAPGSYRARVRAEAASATSEWSDWSSSSRIVDRPDAPRNAAGAVSGKGRVTVTWELGSDNGSPIQNVAVACDGAPEITVTGPQTRAEVALTNGNGRTCRVVARNEIGASDPAALVLGRTAGRKPDAPTSVRAERGDKVAVVRWEPGDDDVDAYEVVASTGQQVSAPESARTATVTGLANGVGVTFSVFTVTNGVRSDAAVTAAVTPAGKPTAPAVFAARHNGSGQIAMNWAAADPNGAPLLGYDIACDVGVPVAAGPGETSKTITVPARPSPAGKNCSISARNELGSSTATAAVIVARDAPAPPGRPTVTRGDRQVALTWTAPAAGAPDDYIVSNGVTTKTVDGASPALTWTELTNGTTYTFTVIAVVDDKNSAPSTPSDPVKPGSAPLAPSGVTVTAEPNTDKKLRVTWAAPASDGGYPVTKYVLSGCGNGGTEATPAELVGKVIDRTQLASCSISVVATNELSTSPAATGAVTFTPLSVSFAVTSTVTSGTAAGGAGVRLSWRCPSLHPAAIETTVAAGSTGTLAATASRDSECLLVASAVSGGPALNQITLSGSAGTGTISGIHTAVLTLPVNAASYAGGTGSIGVAFQFYVPAIATITGVTTTQNSAAVSYSIAGDIAAGGQCTVVAGAATAAGPCGGPITVGGLTPGTSYNFIVRVPGADGQTRDSAPSAAVTKRPPPTAVGVSVVSIGQNDALVNFAPDVGDWSGVACTLVWNGGEQVGGCGQISFAGRLHPSTAYSVQVRTVRDGITATSGAVGFTTAAPPVTNLTVSFTENPFLCNTGVRIFGTVSGALPREFIEFTSPGLSLISYAADDAGNRPIQWQCPPASAGASWVVTARGTTSGRTVTFTVTGR